MAKLKALFSNVSNSIKETYKKFPITIIITYIITLIFALGTDEFVTNFTRNDWFTLMVIWAIGTIFTETWFSKKSSKIIGSIVSLGIAIVFRALIREDVSFEELLERILTTFVMVLPLLTIYKFIKKSELEIKEYSLIVLSNLGKCTILYILANIGILLVLLVFVELILDGNDYDILSRIFVLLLGGYYVPALINSLTDMSSKPTKFVKILLIYVLTPIVSFLIAILYMYLVKIALKGELLHNAIFSILALTFGGAIPISILISNYDESPKIKIISKALVFLFMPFIILQIIAMGIRVNEYGLTESRYMAWMLVAFEIVFIGLMLIKKSKYLDKSIWFVVALVVLGVLSPLNVEAVPKMSQTARIEKLISKAGSFENLNDEEKAECKEVFVYLERNADHEYMIEKLGQENFDKIEQYNIPKGFKNENYYEDYDYIYVNEKTDGIDVEGYSMLYMIYQDYRISENQDYTNYQIKSRNSTIIAEVNLQELIDKMIKADISGDVDEIFKENRILETEDGNIKVYLTNFSMEYEIYTKSISSVNIGGYILVK